MYRVTMSSLSDAVEGADDEGAAAGVNAGRGADGLISLDASQSESSEEDSEVDPVVHLYNQRMRRQPVFPIQKLLQGVSF